MMRKIKFRALRLESDIWEYGFLFINEWGQAFIDKNDWKREPVRLETVGQYTGLHDKNGKEAYHKDLISAYGYSNWIVEWHKNGWYLKQHNIENYKEIPKDFIIMGNIFESNWV
jgi:hypothetical protein